MTALTASVIRGTAGDDNLSGTGSNDTFALWQGGSDTVDGGGGNDVFRMGAALDAGDKLDGGTGKDYVLLNGDYSAGVVFSADTITNIEVIALAGGHSYKLTTNDGNVAAGERVLVKASALGSGNTLTFDGSAELDGKFYIVGGAGNDVLTGGAKHDVFDLSHGGNDTAHGGGGNNTFNMGGAFTSGDIIDGGAGTNTLNLDGDYSTALTVSGAMAQNIGTVTLSGDNNYNVVWQSAIGSTLTVDASTVGSGFSVTFDASALTSGDVHFIAGADINTFTGGSGDDVVDLQNSGPYDVHGGGGDDTVNFGANYGAGPFFLDFADGGTGSNTVTFDGDYSAGITLGPESFLVFTYGLSNYQTVKLLGDHSYTVTFDDTQGGGATLTGGAALTVDASALGTSDHANLDFSLSAAPGFTVTGSAGDDTITFAANFSGSDTIDGGAGNNDTLKLNGDYSAGITLGASTMTNFETLVLGAGHDYNITFDDGNIAAGIEFSVDTTALSGNTFTLDDSAETDGVMVVRAGAAFTTADSFIGGTADAALLLDGDYSGGLVFGATTAENLTDIELAGGHSYNLTLNAATPAVGADMAVAAAALGAGDTLTVDGSAVTDAHLNFYGGAGNDVITGGQDGDLIDISTGGNDTVHGGSGGNEFDVGGALTAADSIDGGGGAGDLIAMAGDYTGANALVMGAATVTRVDELQLGGGTSYDITTNDATVASGATLNVDASSLGAGDTFTFNGSAETDGRFNIVGGAGNDTITGGNHGNTITGGGGADTITAGAGADMFFYTSAADSAADTKVHADTIGGFDASADHFHLPFAVTFLSGVIAVATADDFSDFGAVANSYFSPGENDAVVFHVTSGALAGHSILLIDFNGDSFYSGASDLAIDITGYTGTITGGDFI